MVNICLVILGINNTLNINVEQINLLLKINENINIH